MIKGYFDGAVRGDINQGSIGAYIEVDGNTIWEVSKATGYNKKSIDTEYDALLALLHEIRHRDLINITIYGDNKVCIDQMNHVSRVRDLTLFKLAAEAEKLMKSRSITLVWIPREQNKKADWLSKQPPLLQLVNSSFTLDQVAEHIFIVHAEETYVSDIQHGICSCPQYQLGTTECIHLATARQQHQFVALAAVA